MKRKFTFLLTAAIMLLLVNMPLMALADNEVTCPPYKQGWVNSNNIGEGTLKDSDGENTIFTYTSGTGSDGANSGPKYYSGDPGDIRFYAKKNNTNGQGNWMQINVPDNTTITGIELTASQTTTVKYNIDGGSDVSWSASGGKYSLTDISVTNSFKFRNAHSTNNQVRITSIKITYTTSGGGQQQTVATPQISHTTDTYYGTQFVTISCSTTDANIYYTMDTNPSAPTSSSTPYTGAIQVTETMTIKAIAVKDGMQDSGVATETLTIQPAAFDQDWEGTMDGWKFVSVSGNQTWAVSTYNNNKFAKMSGYANSTNNANEDWIISPAFNLSNYSNPVLTFTSARNDHNGNALEVYFSNDYAGGTNANPTWTQLTCTLPSQPSSGYTDFTSSGDISLSSYSGANCYIGFKYTSTNSAAVTWEVDDIELFSAQPTITVTPNSLSGFTYVEGHGPSTAQTVSVSGSNLTANISLSLGDNSNFEMCLTQNGTYTNNLTLDQSDGSVSATNVYVRLKSGLSKANNYAGTITLTSTDATNKTVSLSGSVTGQTYAVNVATGLTGGSIEADPTSAEAGATISLTAHPEDAYTFGSWSVYKHGDSQTTVTVSNNQFTMPAYAVDVTATFSAKPTYAVTCVANPVAGGTIATEQTPAYEGQSVGLTITPTSGYSLSSVVITKTSDGSATDITVTNNAFTMPGYAVTVTATFVSEIFNGTFMQVSSENALENNGYYIIYNTSAMNSSISSGQMGATTVEINENVISNPNRAIVWKLVQNGDNWNLYSEKEGKYCYIEGTNTSSFKMGTSSSYSYVVTYNNGFKFATTHSSGRCIGYGTTFKSYADDTNNASANTLTLYKYTAGERTITFNGNGGTYNEATSYNQTVNDGIPAALTSNQFTKANAAFAGWATSADGSVVYANGAQIMIHDNTTLFAKWNQAYTATADDQITGGSVYIVIDANNQTTTNAAEGTEITLTYSADLGYAFSAWDVYKTGETATKVTVTNNKFTMPAYNVTISATFEEATTYSLITDIGNIVSGKRYIIASGADGDIKAMGSQNNSHYRNVVPVSSDNGVIAETENVYEFVINGPEIITVKDGDNDVDVEVYTIYDVTGVSGGYIYASSSSDNYMDTQAFNDNNGKWTISIANSGAATIEAQGDKTHYKMRFNSNRFSCYGSNTSVSALPYIYMKNEVTPQYEFYKDITAHTNATGLGNTDGWYFIASPVNSNMAPNSVTNMIAGDADKYDLYRLSGNTLENYKNNEHTAGFVIANGAGYLYSNAANTTLKFSGTLIKEYNNTNKTVAPANTGWNLIGNPFTFPVRVSRAFSELNNGSAVNSKGANSIINPGAGIIVYGTDDVTFTKYVPEEQSSGPSNINIMLAQQVASRDGSSTTSVNIDNAIVSFNENSRLPKFTMLEGNAKLYIPQNGEDYAIAFSNRQGDMPLNFKAKELGTYTISFEGEEMDLNGIYLIDMLDEVEIDLSVNPSHTFIGSPADRSARFKIVFKNNGNDSTSDIFAYQSGSDIVVSGEGELQIFDVMGRMVARQNVNGVQTINAMAHGVYIFKLNEKTQKIIVK